MAFKDFIERARAGTIGKIATKIATVTTRPIASILNYKKAEKATLGESRTASTVRVIQNAALVATPLTGTGRAIVAGAARKLVTGSPLAIVGKLGGATAAAGALIASPRIREGVSGFLPSAATAGQRVGQLVEGTGKASPEDVGRTIAGAAIGAGLLGTAAGYLYEKSKDKDLTPSVPALEIPSLSEGSPIAAASPSNYTVEDATPTTERKKRSIRRYTKKKQVPTIVNTIKIDDRDVYSVNGKVYKHRNTRK